MKKETRMLIFSYPLPSSVPPSLPPFPQLFLGTEKYPRENTYKDLVSKSGGSSNASTSMDLTLYKFESSADAFEDVLDVFAQFFICEWREGGKEEGKE